MNLDSVRHLLCFELKRIKWLVVAAWVCLAMAFAPRMMDALGWWNFQWYEVDDFLANGGMVGFLLAGWFLAIWSGLLERNLSKVRPVSRWAIRVVSWGVLMMVMVVPVLGLTLVSLWFQGFSRDVILQVVGLTALTVIPMWAGLRLLAKYAGSFQRTIVGFVVIGCLVFLADSFRFRGLGQPWINALGMWLESGRWVATLIPAILMGGLWGLVRNRIVLTRLSVAVLSVVMGWVGMFWVITEKEKVSFESEFSETVVIGESNFSSRGMGYLSYRVVDDREGEMTVWQAQGDFKDDQGRVYRSMQDEFSDKPFHWVGREAMSAVAIDLLEDDTVFINNWTGPSSKTGRAAINYWAREIRVTLPVDYSRGERVRLSGHLVGKRLKVDHFVEDAPFGEGREFQSGDMKGVMSWRDGEYEGDPRQMEVVVTEPFSMKGVEEGEPENRWMFLLKYPKAKVVVQGDVRWSGEGERVGGVRQWRRRLKFENSELWRHDVQDEIPVVSIYRVRVVECGSMSVRSEPVVLIKGEQGVENSDYQTLLYGMRRGDGPPSTESWKSRPAPEKASRDEVGAWFRRLEWHYRYAGSVHDLAQYAEHWGELFFRTSEKSKRNQGARMGAFAAGASDEGREWAIGALGGVSSDASILVERGWDMAAREKVAQVIQDGERAPDTLRLGILLGLGGIEDAVIEGLVDGGSWELYEAARLRLKIGDRMDEILDERLRKVEEEMEESWALSGGEFRFRSGPWLWLLHGGRKGDLARCLAWMEKAHQDRVLTDWEKDYRLTRRFKELLFDQEKFRELIESEGLTTEKFDWDPVLRKWIFNEKGKTK